MPKKWRSANQQEKRREQSRLRNEMFLIKKDNERLAKDMEARQAALEKLGIKENFDFEDHHEIYSFADHNAPINQPPIKVIDCTVPLQQSRHIPNIQFRSIQPNRPSTCISSALRRGCRRSTSRSTSALPVNSERAVRKAFCRCMFRQRIRLSSDKVLNESKCEQRAAEIHNV